MKQRLIAASCSVVIGISGASALLNHYCTGCYKIVVEGKTIGYVEDSDQYQDALDKVNETISADFGEENILKPDAEISGVILEKDKLSTQEELHDNIAMLSSYMTEGYVISANGEDVCAFKSEKDARETLSLMCSMFVIDGGISEIREDVIINKKQVSTAGIKTPEEAAKMLIDEGKLNVKTTVSTVYYSTKEFKTVEEEDETLIKGNTIVVREGQVGEYAVSAVIEYNNGVHIGKSILSEALVSEPTDEVIKVGTKIVPGMGSGEFIMPTSGRISSYYGGRWGRLHKGIDIAAATGTAIKASDTGVVIYSGYKGSYGNLVKIDHKNGYVTYYAHCSELLVSEGETVTKGQLIAKVGNTGNSTGPHCHFEIQLNEEALNPMEFLK